MEQRVAETVRKVIAYGFSFATIAALAYVGEKGTDGGFIKDVWTAAKTASPFAAMLCLMLLLDERKERREAQRQCAERTIDFIKTVNVGNRALDKMAEAVERGRKK
jgi:hypothetical protein